MTGHVIKYIDFGDGRHKARCKCGQSSFDVPTWQAANDWARKHHRNIEVIKAYLGNRNPSLESQADYYRAKSLEDRDAKQRKLWGQLADELDTRLGRTAPPSKQEEIPLGDLSTTVAQTPRLNREK